MQEPEQLPSGEQHPEGPTPPVEEHYFSDQREIAFTQAERRLFRRTHRSNMGSHDPRKNAAAEILPSLARAGTPSLPMSRGYRVAGKSPHHTNYRAYVDKLSQFGTPPLGPNGNPALMCGSDIFDWCIAPLNFIMQADHWLIDRFAGELSQYIRGKNLIELGSGNAKKTAHLSREMSGHPASCRLVDNVPDKLKKGKDEILHHGAAMWKVFKTCGDILTKRFYEDSYWNAPDNVVFSCGNLFGDFKDEEENFIYGNLHRVLKSGDKLILMVNNTIDLDTVKQTYKSHYYLQFFMNAFLDAMDSIGVRNLDYSALGCEMRFVENKQEESITIEINIINTRHQKLALIGGDVFALERGRINAGYIRNRSHQSFVDRTRGLGFPMEARFAYRPSNPALSKADYNCYVLSRAP